jgi:nucleoside-diphosphate-sugar epimerase
MKSPVVLTGGTGYLGAHILSQLLEKGYEVRLTSRNPKKTKNETWIKDLVAKHGTQLSFYAADLEKEGSFDAAMIGAKSVIHAASPFKIEGIKDAKKELIDPAVNGTTNVLGSVDKNESIEKVVLTSSMASIYGDAIDIELYSEDTFDESHWNTSSSIKHQPYSFSKVSAERAAWSMNTDKNWKLNTINPGFILGPSLTKRADSTSIKFIVDMLAGKYKTGVPHLYFAVVDVRDVAAAHISALENDSATGRFVCCSETKSILEIAKELRTLVPDRQNKIPSRQLPNWLAYIFAPLLAGFSWNYLKKNLGIPVLGNNAKIKKELGMEFRPLSETLLAHAQQVKQDGLLKK